MYIKYRSALNTSDVWFLYIKEIYIYVECIYSVKMYLKVTRNYIDKA